MIKQEMMIPWGIVRFGFWVTATTPIGAIVTPWQAHPIMAMALTTPRKPPWKKPPSYSALKKFAASTCGIPNVM